MKTTYFLTHESINCPICGKLLRESKSYDEVACSDPQCRFNDSHSKDQEVLALQLDRVSYFRLIFYFFEV